MASMQESSAQHRVGRSAPMRQAHAVTPQPNPVEPWLWPLAAYRYDRTSFRLSNPAFMQVCWFRNAPRCRMLHGCHACLTSGRTLRGSTLHRS